MAPALDSGEDVIGGFGPDEGFGGTVGLGDEAVDRGLKVDDGFEHSALQPLSRQLGQEAFDRVGPGARGRGEVEGEAAMPPEPGFHLGVVVGGVVVEDHVNRLAFRDLGLDGIEKADEFLMPVTLHAAADDLAFEDVEGGEQGCGAV